MNIYMNTFEFGLTQPAFAHGTLMSTAFKLVYDSKL